MNTKENQSSNKILKRQFTVSTDNLDDNEQLAICTLLKEITKLNDTTIVETMGTLDFEKIISSQCKLNFLAKAHLSDLVELRSESTVSDNTTIEIKVSVWKKKGKRSALLADGYFVYDTEDIIARPLSLL